MIVAHSKQVCISVINKKSFFFNRLTIYIHNISWMLYLIVLNKRDPLHPTSEQVLSNSFTCYIYYFK